MTFLEEAKMLKKYILKSSIFCREADPIDTWAPGPKTQEEMSWMNQFPLILPTETIYHTMPHICTRTSTNNVSYLGNAFSRDHVEILITSFLILSSHWRGWTLQRQSHSVQASNGSIVVHMTHKIRMLQSPKVFSRELNCSQGVHSRERLKARTQVPTFSLES